MPCLFPHSPTVRMGDKRQILLVLIVNEYQISTTDRTHARTGPDKQRALNGGGFAKEVRRPRRSDSPVGETGRSGPEVVCLAGMANERERERGGVDKRSTSLAFYSSFSVNSCVL